VFIISELRRLEIARFFHIVTFSMSLKCFSYDLSTHINSGHHKIQVRFCTIVSALYQPSGLQQSAWSVEIHCDVYWQTCLHCVKLLLNLRDKTLPLSTRQLISYDVIL